MVVSRQVLWHAIAALCVGVVAAACVINGPVTVSTEQKSSPTVNPTATVVPATQTPQPTATALPTATETPRPAINPLPEFPLTMGSTWVYSHTEYNVGVQTTDCCITLTVVSNQMVWDYFVAEIEQDQAFASEWPPFLPGVGKANFWYAISPSGEVYFLTRLVNVDFIPSAYLMYRFPLDQKGYWYHSAQDRQADSGFNYTFAEGPQEFTTPAGVMDRCYWVATPYNSGGVQEWVCEGVGFVENKYDHNGTPYGYETVLLSYEIMSP